MMLVAGFLMLLASPPEPSYTVERVVRVSGEVRRVTLFRDGVGVVLIRTASGEERLHHTPVGELVSRQVEQVVREVYPEMLRFSAMGDGPRGGEVELRLAPPGLEPYVIRLSLQAAPSAAAARLAATLDALEERVLKDLAPAEDLREWEPKTGERVELDDRTIHTVVDVFDTAAGGRTVRLRQGNSPASVFMDLGELRRRAVRRVPEGSR
jgi:hypothetical protein